MKLSHKIIFTLPFFILMITIFILSNQSRLPVPMDSFEFEDKIIHLIAYFILGITTILSSIVNFPNLSKNQIIILAILIGCFYGFTDEIHQGYISGRDASIFDWFADATGIILSTFLYNLILKYFKKFVLLKVKTQ